MLKLPTRDQVREKISGLIADKYTRQEISDWANQWVANEHERVEDFVVWELLCRLSAADLISLERPYLYEKIDFNG